MTSLRNLSCKCNVNHVKEKLNPGKKPFRQPPHPHVRRGEREMVGNLEWTARGKRLCVGHKFVLSTATCSLINLPESHHDNWKIVRWYKRDSLTVNRYARYKFECIRSLYAVVTPTTVLSESEHTPQVVSQTDFLCTD